LKISSMKATSASGRYPLVCRTYLSSSRARMDRGPKSSWRDAEEEKLR
jgi:hypothetical protein